MTSCGYRTCLVHFGIERFFASIPTGLRSRRRGGSAFFRKPLGFVMSPRESVGGCAPPNLRQRAIGSLDSLHLGRDVGAFYAARGKQVQRRLDRLAFVLRLSCVPVEMSCVRSRLLFAACAPNRTACGMFRSCSAVGRDRHSCVLESSVRLSGFVGSLRACAFLYGDPDGERRDGGTRRTEGTGNGVGGAAECVFA